VENTGCHIRSAQLKDIDAVLEIEIKGSNLWNRDFFTRELDISFSRFCVAEYDSHVIAFAVAWEIEDEIQLLNIGVSDGHKRRGIGSALIRYLLKTSSNPGKIYVELKEKNSTAYLFYTSNGFLRTGTRKNYYSDDNALLMEKTVEE